MMKNDYYVYVYSHPDTRQPFYVGKGRGGRALAHMNFDKARNDKQKRIAGLLGQGRKPIIEIVQWGMSQEAAYAAEAALIQFIGLNQVTNRLRGHGGRKLHVDFIEYLCDKSPLKIQPRKGREMLILSARGFYRPGMNRFELYDAVRGNLENLDAERAEACRQVLVVFQGKVLDVYDAPTCVEAGTEVRAFLSDKPDGYDIVAKFASPIVARHYVGLPLEGVKFFHRRFAYKTIRIPLGRF